MKSTKRLISLVMTFAVLATMFVAVPVSAETEVSYEDLLNLDFEAFNAGDALAGHSFWTSNASDGFSGVVDRNGNLAQIIAESASNKSLTLRVNDGVNTIEIKNVGANQQESAPNDDAQYFNEDSIFGTPYYVELDFKVNKYCIPYWQIFGQYFKGKINGTDIVSSGPSIRMTADGYLTFADGFAKNSATEILVTGDGTSTNQVHQIDKSTWHHLKVYVDPAARTYQVWFKGAAVQKNGETGSNPTAFKFGATWNNPTDTLTAGNTSTSMIGTLNTNEYCEENDVVLAPNRMRFQMANSAHTYIDNLHIYRQDQVVSQTVVVKGEGETALNIDFENVEDGEYWGDTALGDSATDGFYGAHARQNWNLPANDIYDSLVEKRDENNNYLIVGKNRVNQIEFKNVGAGQEEGTPNNNAEYFGEDSIFGKPYYVDLDFKADATNGAIYQLFGQHFEGTLADGTTKIVSSGPRIYIDSAGRLGFANGFKGENTAVAENVEAQQSNQNGITTITKKSYTITNGEWAHLRVYVDPVARTYQVWFNDEAVQIAGEQSAAPTAFKFGAVWHNNTVSNNTLTALDSGTWSGAGANTMPLVNGKNPDAYIKGAGIVLAPNRTRFQTHAGELNIDNLKISYPYNVEKILISVISKNVDFEINRIIFPTSSDSNYTVTWESLNEDIVGDDGAISSITSETQTAKFKVTVTDTSGQRTANQTVDITIPARSSFLDEIYKTPQRLAPRVITEETGLTTKYINIEGEPTIRTYPTSQNWTSDGKSFICGLQSGMMFLYNTENETLTFIDHSLPARQLIYATVGTDDYVYYVKKDENSNYSIWKANLKVAPAVPELLCNALNGYSIGQIHVTNDCKYLSAELATADSGAQTITGRYSVDEREWVTYTHPEFDFSPAKTHDIINPEYPNLVSFCHEINHNVSYDVNARNITDRIWQVDLDTMLANNIFKQGVHTLKDTENGNDVALQGATHEVWSNDGEYMYFITFKLGSRYNTGSVPSVVRIDKDGSHRKYYHGNNASAYDYKHCTPTGDNKFVGTDGNSIVVISTDTWQEFEIAEFTPYIDEHPYHAHPVIAREQYVMNWGDTVDDGLLGIKWYDFTNLVSSTAEGGITQMGENVKRVSFEGLDCESVASEIDGKTVVSASSGKSIYLDIEESLIDTDNGKIKLTFDYYDNGSQNITVTYTSGVETDNDRYRIFDAQDTITRGGTNTWKTAKIIIDSGNFEDIGKYNTDIKISGATSDVLIANISAELYGEE